MNTYQACGCLSGLVGWRELSDTRGDCTLYLNDLPGVSNQAANNLLDTETPTRADWLDKVEAQAIQSLYTRFLVLSDGKMRRKGRNEKRTSGQFDQPFDLIGTTANEYRGLVVDLRFSEYSQLFLRRIKYRSSTVADTSIFVYDIDTGELLGSHALTTVANTVGVLNIDTPYFGGRLLICYDASVLNMTETSMYADGYGVMYDCGCREGAVTVPSTGDVIYENTQSAGSVGMIVEYDVRCSPEVWLCKHKELASVALQYEMGITLLNNTRLSRAANFVTLQAEDMAQLREIYAQGRDDALMRVYEAVSDDYCFECDAPVVMKTVLP